MSHSFVSNTTAAGANQFFFESRPEEKHTCRVFYRVTTAGTYPYSLSFTNILGDKLCSEIALDDSVRCIH